MRAGFLRHRLEVQAPTDTVGDTGNPDTTYTLENTIWASVEPLTVTEQLKAQQIAATATHMVTIRYYPNLTQKHRFRMDQREFAIESILPTEMRRIEMKILVREEVK